MIVISAHDLTELGARVAAEEPFKTLIKKDPSLLLTLGVYTTEIITRLIPNPFKDEKENDESEATE